MKTKQKQNIKIAKIKSVNGKIDEIIGGVNKARVARQANINKKFQHREKHASFLHLLLVSKVFCSSSMSSGSRSSSFCSTKCDVFAWATGEKGVWVKIFGI
jgi:hypothetical protein